VGEREPGERYAHCESEKSCVRSHLCNLSIMPFFICFVLRGFFFSCVELIIWGCSTDDMGLYPRLVCVILSFIFGAVLCENKKTQKNIPPRQGGGVEGGVGGVGVETLPREYRLRVSMLCTSLSRALSLFNVLVCWV
jgi:hypothetical protein